LEARRGSQGERGQANDADEQYHERWDEEVLGVSQNTAESTPD